MANKGKKASKGSAEANNTWDVALVNETIDDVSKLFAKTTSGK